MHSLSVLQFLAVTLNHEHESCNTCRCSKGGQLHPWLDQQEKSQEVKGRNLSLLSSTCKTTSGALHQLWALQYKKDTDTLGWGQWRATWMVMEPSSFSTLRTWLNKALRNLFYLGLPWDCGCSRWPLQVSPNQSYFINPWLHVISSKPPWRQNLAPGCIKSFFSHSSLTSTRNRNRTSNASAVYYKDSSL